MILLTSKQRCFGGYKNTFNPPSPSTPKVKKLSSPTRHDTDANSHRRSPRSLHHCNHPLLLQSPFLALQTLDPLEPTATIPLDGQSAPPKNPIVYIVHLHNLVYFFIIMILCLIFHFYNFFFISLHSNIAILYVL